MRSILTIIVACSLLPLMPLAAQSNEQQQKQQPVKPIPTITKSNPPVKQEQEPDLDFSGTGRPGQQTAGESRGACANNLQPIRAIIPASNTGQTVASHPQFWVYFPEEESSITAVEFVIQDEARKDIWRSQSLSPVQSKSSLNPFAGYQSFALPPTAKPLQIGQWYRWYVKVYCQDQVASEQYVQGWVKRVPLYSKLYLELQNQSPQQHHQIYSHHHLWYDATDRLLSSLQSNPGSLALEHDWQNLLRAKGVELEQLPSLAGGKISQKSFLKNR